jgi:hypothetical protein
MSYCTLPICIIAAYQLKVYFKKQKEEKIFRAKIVSVLNICKLFSCHYSLNNTVPQNVTVFGNRAYLIFTLK